MHSFQVKAILKYSQRLLFTRTSASGRSHLLQLHWGYVKQQANILIQTAETARSCRTTLSYGPAINSCEHKFFWSGALTSRALCQELMVSQCHQLIMFQVPEPVMKTMIIMFCSLVLCSYADFCQSLANHFGVQKPTAGKLVIEASQAVSQFSLFQTVPLGSTESHKPPSHCQLSGAICRFCIPVLWVFTVFTKSSPALLSCKASWTIEGDLLTPLLALLVDLMTSMLSGNLTIWGTLATSSSHRNQIS